MSQAGLQELLEQLTSDAAFRERTDVDPEGSIGGHDLTTDESDALLSWDPERIEAALGSPLTDTMRAVIAEMSPSMMLTPSDTPPATYEAPQTPGGRLSIGGYKQREH
jgi:hypothetical protein